MTFPYLEGSVKIRLPRSKDARSTVQKEKDSSLDAPSAAGRLRLGIRLRRILGMRHHAARGSERGSSTVHRRVRLHARWVAAGRSPLQAAAPGPDKLPVILCHGLGLNATFWTITDYHLPSQLTSRGYDVYVFDIRGSGENAHLGRCDRLNQLIRQTPMRERGERDWNVDDLVRYDVPAILDYVQRETGRTRSTGSATASGECCCFPTWNWTLMLIALPHSWAWGARSSRRKRLSGICSAPTGPCGYSPSSPARDGSDVP